MKDVLANGQQAQIILKLEICQANWTLPVIFLV